MWCARCRRRLQSRYGPDTIYSMNALFKNNKKFWLVLFVIYMLVVLKLTVFRSNTDYYERQLNLSIFTELIYTYKYLGRRQFVRLFFGNIGWFVPFGFLLPILLKRVTLLKVVFFGFAFSFFIETSQYVFYKGVAELDDLILNVLGVIIGYIVYKTMLNISCRLPGT